MLRNYTSAAGSAVAVFLFGVIGGELVERAQAQTGLDPTSARSSSGQFIIRAPRVAWSPASVGRLEADTNFVRLQPSLVSVSCERLRQILGRELGVNAPWRGQIYVALYAARAGDDPITITSEQFRDGWRYQVEVPNVVEQERYVRAMVQVMLLEMANRGARAHGAEIPTWLASGLGRQLLLGNAAEIVLAPPQSPAGKLSLAATVLNLRPAEPLLRAHEQLRAATPLTFAELSWPGPDPAAGENSELYRSSAQLLVHQLLALPDGPACFRAMLSGLPERYNWQFAFFDAFRTHFEDPLAIEKWWALQCVFFTGRDLNQTWPAEESLRKLAEVVGSAVEIRTGTNDLPLHAVMPLQRIITDYDYPRQSRALQGKQRELELLRLRVAPEIAPVVDGYCEALTVYLRDSAQNSVIPFRRQALRRRATEAALRDLDALDARRTGLPAAPPAAAPTQASATSAR